MRLLLALATVAMATAIPMPADQFAAISIAPLIIPPEVAEAFRRDLEINPPINYIDSDAQKFEDASLVHFVDVAEAAPSAVKFVDAPLSELESPVESFKIVESSDDGQIVIRNMPSGHADADFHVISVRFADSPLEEEIAPVPVRFVDAPVPVAAVYADVSEDVEAIAPTAVKFVEAPAESIDSIRIAEVNEDAEVIAPTAVKFVDAPLEEEVAPIEAEVIAPTAVKFVDAPLEEKVAPLEAEVIAPTAVKFVDAPVGAESVDSIRIAEVNEDAEVIAPTAVKFVDAPLEEDIAPIEAEAEDSIRIAEVIAPTAVKFVDAPFEGEVVLSAVKFVDAPLEEAESNDGPEFHNAPFKFQDPLLR